MFGLVTMLLSTLVGDWMAVCLRFLYGMLFKVCQSLKPRKNVVNLLEICKSVEWTWSLKMLIGETDKDTGMFTRATRRLIAFMGMLNFAIISILCTLYPGVTLVTFSNSLKTKNPPKSFRTHYFPEEQILPPVLRRDTSLLLQSPLWGQSLDSISDQRFVYC